MTTTFRDTVLATLDGWGGSAAPSREDYLSEAARLLRRRRERGLPGLWPDPPRMATATIDDGWGHGLDVIERLAEAAGVRVERLGCLVPAARIVAHCRRYRPDLLGLTVLQFDADDAVAGIVQRLPPETTLVAGGAAYRYDPDFADRTGTPHVARDGVAFLRFLVGYRPPAIRRGGNT